MLQTLTQTPAEPATPLLTDAESAAAARAVCTLFARWDLSDAEARELLGGMAARTWSRWKSGEIGRIDRDLATRLSLLLGIHKALRIIFGTDTERAYARVRQPNAAFGGASALDVMLRGGMFDLSDLRRYLDAERGGW